MRCLVIALLLLGLISCRPSGMPAAVPRLGVTNTYLESVARDLLHEPLHILRLAEPGMCPGHFDLRPSQVAELRASRLLLRFDFQKSLDKKLAGGNSLLTIVSITTPGGLCRPDTYLAACRQVAAAFVAAGWLDRAGAERRLAEIDTRLRTLAAQLKQQVSDAGLNERPVLASDHQRDFCEWLGLRVVGTFRSSDVAQVSELDRAINAGETNKTQLVIANRPEGRRTADALAERLGARVVVFGNFPEEQNGQVRFDDLIIGNVTALLAAVRP